jgi:hypothetical protein
MKATTVHIPRRVLFLLDETGCQMGGTPREVVIAAALWMFSKQPEEVRNGTVVEFWYRGSSRPESDKRRTLGEKIHDLGFALYSTICFWSRR